jgi:AraC family transcriptional regulator, regulatory protein of adaptative response / DNA-3-methyladenine glycosylase II
LANAEFAAIYPRECMDLNRRVCDRARRSRDPRFDGRFFIGVTTTRVYCRPVCPARTPKDEHVRYFPSAAAAEAAGFRPCLRCRPEAAPGTPAWFGTAGVVSRGLRLIAEGALDVDGVERLAGRLGVTGRHLRRLFLQHLGATPAGVASTRRVHSAKKLLDETALPVSEVAYAAGFGSVRRLNSEIRRTYSRTPTELRRLARQPSRAATDGYRFRLAYRPPYGWRRVLDFLAARATPGVECVADERYRRVIHIDGKIGWVDVSPATRGPALDVRVRFPDPRALLLIVERVRRMFDLDADPAVIAEHLRADPLLRVALAAYPGVRTPGTWDVFELAVRAILGQQISVTAATTIAGRVAALCGTPVALADAPPGLDRRFPTPAQLADAPLERAGIPSARAETIRRLAREVVGGRIAVPPLADAADAVKTLRAVRGIGEWTAQYIAMRGLGDPDALPSGDLVLCRAAGCTPRELDRRSAAWRPWRAYAVILLWQSASDEARRTSHETRSRAADGGDRVGGDARSSGPSRIRAAAAGERRSAALRGV